MERIADDSLIEIFNMLSDWNKMICRIVSTRWNKVICEHVIFEQYLAPVYFDDEGRTRVITEVKNIELLLPLFGISKKEGRLIDNKIRRILWNSNFLSHNGPGDPKTVVYSLQEAADRGNVLMVKSILADPKVEPYINSCDGSTDRVIVSLLINHPKFKFSEAGDSTLVWACWKGYIDIIKKLLRYPRARPGDDDNLCLREAASNGHLEAVKILLKDPRVHKYRNYKKLVAAAVAGGNDEIIKLWA